MAFFIFFSFFSISLPNFPITPATRLDITSLVCVSLPAKNSYTSASKSLSSASAVLAKTFSFCFSISGEFFSIILVLVLGSIFARADRGVPNRGVENNGILKCLPLLPCNHPIPLSNHLPTRVLLAYLSCACSKSRLFFAMSAISAVASALLMSASALFICALMYWSVLLMKVFSALFASVTAKPNSLSASACLSITSFTLSSFSCSLSRAIMNCCCRVRNLLMFSAALSPTALLYSSCSFLAFLVDADNAPTAVANAVTPATIHPITGTLFIATPRTLNEPARVVFATACAPVAVVCAVCATVACFITPAHHCSSLPKTPIFSALVESRACCACCNAIMILMSDCTLSIIFCISSLLELNNPITPCAAVNAPVSNPTPCTTPAIPVPGLDSCAISLPVSHVVCCSSVSFFCSLSNFSRSMLSPLSIACFILIYSSRVCLSSSLKDSCFSPIASTLIASLSNLRYVSTISSLSCALTLMSCSILLISFS